MKIIFLACSFLVLAFTLPTFAQVPTSTHVQILKAEDERRYDKTLEDLLKSPNAKIRIRAALAAGRIGNEKAVPALVTMLEMDTLAEARAMAAFALGEIESITAADTILKMLAAQAETRPVGSVPHNTARLVEAAGKIAAANPKHEKSKALGEAILDTLETEDAKAAKQNREVILLALTAALRARPDETNIVVAKFLTNLDARIRADAANTLSRIRAKNANAALRTMLISDPDPIARANAARALGAAEDKQAFNALLEAATGDEDSRVRVSAIRSLANLKDEKAADRLIRQGDSLLAKYQTSIKLNSNPIEISELLEIAAALGRIVQNSNNENAVRFLTALGEADAYRSPETEIAFARVSPIKYTEYIVEKKQAFKVKRRVIEAALQGMRELASIPDTPDTVKLKKTAVDQIRHGLFGFEEQEPSPAEASVPEFLRSLAAFKPEDLDKDLRRHLEYPGIFIRATAAELLGERPASKENIEALNRAFKIALSNDKDYNDAQLAILDAIFKLDKKNSVESLRLALNAPDHLIRNKAFIMSKNEELLNDITAAESMSFVEAAKGQHTVRAYSPKTGTKLGQVLNIETDYFRAASRRNGMVKAVLTTDKGTFTIDLLPEDAPLTVDNFIKLARSNYFNGLEVHRVVPNFVMQDGDPRGDGNGGPGWSIRCEVNMVPFERGVVGMALSGKDTGGSQWFATHSPQPHLDGGYTVFGRVNETGMKVVDNIVRGDKIISVKILEGNLPQRYRGTEKRGRN